MRQYDYVIVGSGLFGSVFAREATAAGRSCLVLEKRPWIGGNCHTRDVGGIHVHEYGPHIFHTNSQRIWNYMQGLCEWSRFTYRPKARVADGRIFSFPINLLTLNAVWGTCLTPSQAKKRLESVRVPNKSPKTLEEYALSQVGEEIYQLFIRDYTKKQWNRDPRDLPASILKRIPIRIDYNDDYFDDVYQGMPIGGYTQIFRKLLEGIPVETSVDYLSDFSNLDKLARKKIIYTGAIDAFFGYSLGPLEWRSLHIEHRLVSGDLTQGNPVINWTGNDVAWTRTIESSLFEPPSRRADPSVTVISTETPQDWKPFGTAEPFYPINDENNNNRLLSYQELIDQKRYVFGGRLADYRYYDMHQVVASSLEAVRRELS